MYQIKITIEMNNPFVCNFDITFSFAHFGRAFNYDSCVVRYEIC